MEWITQYNIYVQGLILSSIIIATLIATVSILYIFNIKMPLQRIKYVYAFASGFLIVTAIVGQWVTARSNITEHWEYINNPSGAQGDFDPSISQTIISIIILIGGSVLGTSFAYGLKKATGHNHEHPKGQHEGHDHGPKILPDALSSRADVLHEAKVHKEKAPVIWMILAHRVPAGLLLGILLVNFNNGGEYSLAALLVFIVHTIPDMMIVYYARIKAGYSRKNSLVFSILVKLIFVPFIILGISVSHYIGIDSSSWWIIPLLLSIAGVIMLWGAIFELAPTFLALKTSKDTYKIIFAFILGLTISMAIQMVHHH